MAGVHGAGAAHVQVSEPEWRIQRHHGGGQTPYYGGAKGFELVSCDFMGIPFIHLHPAGHGVSVASALSVAAIMSSQTSACRRLQCVQQSVSPDPFAGAGLAGGCVHGPVAAYTGA